MFLYGSYRPENHRTGYELDYPMESIHRKFVQLSSTSLELCRAVDLVGLDRLGSRLEGCVPCLLPPYNPRE